MWKSDSMATLEQQEWFGNNHVYFKKQENTGLSREEFTARLNLLGNTNVDRMNKLSNRTGHTARHPRTSELIRFKTSDVIPKTLLRKGSTAYGTQENRSSGRVFRKGSGKVEKWVRGDKRIKSATKVGRKTGQWKTVWYSRNMRRR